MREFPNNDSFLRTGKPMGFQKHFDFLNCPHQLGLSPGQKYLFREKNHPKSGVIPSEDTQIQHFPPLSLAFPTVEVPEGLDLLDF